jgi:hypothetical protein
MAELVPAIHVFIPPMLGRVVKTEGLSRVG